MQRLFGFVLFVLMVCAGVYVARNGNPFGSPAPNFSLPGVYGGRVELDSYHGRPVLLVFWTTSCPICQRELPLLSRLEPSFRSQGVTLLPINLDGESQAAEFLSSNSLNLTSLFDSDNKVARAYDVGGVPKFVLIDKDGKVRRSASGWASERVLRSWIESVSGS
jgi:peroxiredoxin